MGVAPCPDHHINALFCMPVPVPQPDQDRIAGHPAMTIAVLAGNRSEPMA